MRIEEKAASKTHQKSDFPKGQTATVVRCFVLEDSAAVFTHTCRRLMWFGVAAVLVFFIYFSPNAVYAAQVDADSIQFKAERGRALIEAHSHRGPFAVKPDNFPWDKLEDVSLPSYDLTEDFPQDKIEVFNSFILFCVLTEEYNISSRFSEKYSILSLVQARLNSAAPVRYEDFLATVTLVCHAAYTKMISDSPKAVSFFIKNIMEPLRDDLKTVDYVGYSFDVDDFIDFHEHCGDIVAQLYRIPPPLGGSVYIPFPKSWELLRKCAETFRDIHEGNLRKAYGRLTVWRIRRVSYELPYTLSRPYYFYKDEERYHWFLFLQRELRRVGNVEFADEILETELDHYRELINWQLQARVYMAKRLYEEKAFDDFSAFKKLLKKEYEEIINDDVTKEFFQKAVDALRDIDKKAAEPLSTEKAMGSFALPWIDRNEIDRRMDIPLSPERISW